MDLQTLRDLRERVTSFVRPHVLAPVGAATAPPRTFSPEHFVRPRMAAPTRARATLERTRARARGLEALAAWRAHRALTDGLSIIRPFSDVSCHRLLFVSESDPICRAQLFPFFFYQRALRERAGVEAREVPLAAFRASPATAPGPADTVCLQTWFDLPRRDLLALIDAIRAHHPNAKLVYFDSFAPTDLRLAELLHEHVDLYVKKHVLRDRRGYGRPTRGDTNLMDYFARAYGIDYPTEELTIPDGFLDKLVVGPGFATADYMLTRFLEAPVEDEGARPIDVHARIATKGSAWYSRMRSEAAKAVASLDDLCVVLEPGVKRAAYLNELRSSKLCFSPFGYGEVCWRDYEAAMCGSLLIKPDMGHVETRPDIFIANETYVPVRWDLADLEETVRYYLSHDEERRRVARNAYLRLHEYARSEAFVDDMRELWRTPQHG